MAETRSLREARTWAAAACFLLASFTAAAAGGLFGPGPWYEALRKPAFTPPGWVFPIVWIALYVSMAAGAWLVWKARGLRGGAGALVLFAVQLALNAAWTPVFFGLRSPGLAFALIVVLWLAVAATTAAFFRACVAAGALMAPYLAWVSFATALNFEIWRLNP